MQWYIKLRNDQNYQRYWSEIKQKAEDLFNQFNKHENSTITNIQKRDLQEIDDIIPKLSARLFIIKLWTHRGSIIKKEVYKFLMRFEDEPSDNSIKQLFSFHLLIDPEEDIPSFNLLPEERFYHKEQIELRSFILQFRRILPIFYQFSGQEPPQDLENLINFDDIVRALGDIKNSTTIVQGVKREIASQILKNLGSFPQIKKILREILEDANRSN